MKSILHMTQRYLDGNDLWPALEHVWAPEEVYFPTALSLLGVLRGDEVVLRSLVHSQWPPGTTVSSMKSWWTEYEPLKVVCC